jgi:hypothetical protein
MQHLNLIKKILLSRLGALVINEMSDLTCVHGLLLCSSTRGLTFTTTTAKTLKCTKQVSESSSLSAAIQSVKDGHWRDAITSVLAKTIQQRILESAFLHKHTLVSHARHYPNEPQATTVLVI